MKKFLVGLMTVALGLSLASAPVFAADPPADDCADGVKTAILGDNHCFKTDTEGGGIIEILLIVIDIMTVGIGILGVIGIIVVGIQYLTAGGSEEKTRVAKRRMFEIVIGLIAYAIMYAFLKWLLPTLGGSS